MNMYVCVSVHVCVGVRIGIDDYHAETKTVVCFNLLQLFEDKLFISFNDLKVRERDDFNCVLLTSYYLFSFYETFHFSPDHRIYFAQARVKYFPLLWDFFIPV